MYKGQDGWVPFDEMQQEIQRGVTQAVTNPTHPYSDVQQYINNMLAVLAYDYVEVSRYSPPDHAMRSSLHGRARALCELALHFNIYVDVPDCFRG